MLLDFQIRLAKVHGVELVRSPDYPFCFRRAGSAASDPAGRTRALRRHAAEAAGGLPEPYRLRAVGHSLGGASLLIYAVMCRRLNRPHHIYRLILLTPAGFLQKLPLVRLCSLTVFW